jgi:general secretion pathway protein D
MRFPNNPLLLGILLMSPLAPCGTLRSQTTDGSSPLIAESERSIVRSQENLLKAQSLMKQAQGEQSRNDLKAAYLKALEAVSIAPSGEATDNARPPLLNAYTSIAIAYARELINEGVFTDSIAEQYGIRDSSGAPLSAESVLKTILKPSMNPGNREAVKLLSDLEQPDVFNKTVTPKFAAQREEVVRLLREANGLAQSGRSELAMKQYEAVLVIDPYNNAARKGMESLHQTAINYSNEAYNETRSRMLWQVEKIWERPPQKSKQGRSTESVGRQQDVRGTDQIVAKLNSIIIPKIDLNESPVSEAVEYLKQKSVEQDPNKKGVNIFLKLNPQQSIAPIAPGVVPTTNPVLATSTAEPHVTLSLSHVPLYVVLEYISNLCNLKLKIDPYAVSIVPLSEPTDILITKEYKVPPTFIPQKTLDSSSGLPAAAGLSQSSNNMPRVAARYNAQEYLASQGVDFPTGASANYIPTGSKLVIRNTRDNIDLIDSLVDAAMGVAPSQVSIETKFVEITQNNLQELGFDWLLGPFNIGGGVYGSGGGGVSNTVAGNYPFNASGMNSVGALRTGDAAIPQNSVNALLAGQSANTTTPAPGIFSIGGIFSDPQFQLVIRGLNQKKGVDLMSAPKVTTKSGVKAIVKITDEFIYPKQYDPPQIPQSVSNTGTPPTVTPSFPRNFTEQDLGVLLEAKPTIGPDGYTIDLELDPKVVDFDGFINYGSPINAVGYTESVSSGILTRTPILQTLTTNTINQPVFTTREVNTFVTVWDGQTVSLGGLITENVVKAQDKIPFLGDIPLAGRLFRSNNDQKIKENLIIFVTPRILNAEGQPRRDESEEPEIVKPLGLPQDIPIPFSSSPANRGK